jgi:NhaP-type Na+/H+ or K+/H+ antiporter
VGASLLAVLVVSVILAAVARRYDVSAPLALVVAGLLAGLLPGFKQIELNPELVLYVLLPPLLWSAGLESSYVALRRNIRPIGLLAVGLPLATTFAVGYVAYKTVPELTVAAALTLGAIVAPPDAVSATAVGRRLGLPRRMMTLLGGESLLNDATALTAYKVSLAAAIGTAATWGSGLATFALAAVGGVAVGLAGISARVIAISSVAVLATVIGVRLVWVYVFAYLPRMLFKGIRDREPVPPTPAEVFVVAWAGMRGVVSLAAAFGVPMTTMSGAPFPGRPQLVFLTFVVVIGTLLLHGLTLPWLIRRLGVQGDEARTDAIATAAAQDKAARAAAERLDELLAEEEVTDVHERAADVLRGWNTRRRNSAWERLGRDEAEIGESPVSAFRRLRLEMLAAERATFIAERDNGQIDDEVLRTVLRGLDLEEATLNRG